MRPLHLYVRNRAGWWWRKMFALFCFGFLEWTPQLLDGIGKMQDFGVHLVDKSLQFVDRVEDLDAFGVRIEAHFEWTRHGAHPATELVLGILEALGYIVNGLILLILIRLHSCGSRLKGAMLALVADGMQQFTVGAQETSSVGLDLAVFLAETELNSEPVDLFNQNKSNKQTKISMNNCDTCRFKVSLSHCLAGSLAIAMKANGSH